MKIRLSFKDRIGKIYHRTLGRFAEIASLYKLDIANYDLRNEQGIEEKYEFLVFQDLDDRFVQYYDQIPGKIETVKARFASNNYACFAYIDTIQDVIGYTRWICKNEFFSDILNERLKFTENEVLTLDSYTHPKFRGQGLHKAMNIAMLNWLKMNTNYTAVYMVIKDFIPYLAKYPLMLGYKKQYTRISYKKGSVKKIVKMLLKKNPIMRGKVV